LKKSRTKKNKQNHRDKKTKTTNDLSKIKNLRL